MDLGSKFPLTLSRALLDRINKKNGEKVVHRDMRGNRYETPSFQIPLVRIGDFSCTNAIVSQESDDFVANTTFWTDPKLSGKTLQDHVGTVGRTLLDKKNLLLDFHKSVFFISNDINQLKKAGYHLENFCKCAYEMGRTGLILVVTTAAGKARLSLDTGSTVTFIRASLVPDKMPKEQDRGLSYVKTSAFEIENRNFGPMNLYLQEITPELTEVDGFLGMDFLKKHIVYIDQAQRMIYISRSL